MTILKSPARNLSYEEAVSALNSLQTNAITLKKTRKERQANVHLNLPITRKYLERSGMSLEDLDQLKIIHVSGTKGKGSTCAFCESILRHSGLKTGFYSSPHLVSVTERIRINGEPIDQVGRAKYFHSALSMNHLSLTRLLLAKSKAELLVKKLLQLINYPAWAPLPTADHLQSLNIKISDRNEFKIQMIWASGN